MLTISYATRELQRACASIGEAQALLGPEIGGDLLQLIAEAEAFLNAAELIDFRGGRIEADDSLSITIGGGYRAFFNAVGDNPPRADGGAIRWGQVRRIILVEVGTCE